MKKKMLFLGCIMMIIIGFWSSALAGGSITKHRACKELEQAALTYHFVKSDVLGGSYYCDLNYSDHKYFVIGLHYSYRATHATVSNLVGWYAIRKSDGKIFDYDMANLTVGAPVSSR